MKLNDDETCVSCLLYVDSVRESSSRVLVHCLAGISRSPTIVIAYVMHHLRLSIDDAYRYHRMTWLTCSRSLPVFNFAPALKYACLLTWLQLLPLHARHTLPWGLWCRCVLRAFSLITQTRPWTAVSVNYSALILTYKLSFVWNYFDSKNHCYVVLC